MKQTETKDERAARLEAEETRIEELEAEGLTRSRAQGVFMYEQMRDKKDEKNEKS